MIILAALLYGLAPALVLTLAYWLYRRARDGRRGFPWSAAAAFWVSASLGVLVLMYATLEG